MATRIAAGGGSRAALTVFIVEDSALILERLVEVLEEAAPVKVVGHADSEGAAIRAVNALDAAQQPPDLLVIDVFLHGGSGLGVLRHGLAHGWPARRVVLTNYATPDLRRTCESLGAHRVFDKSAQLDELIDYCCSLAGDDVRERAAPRRASGGGGAEASAWSAK